MELLQKARALYEKGQMHDALEVAQVACERKPKDAEAWWLLACISRYTGMPAASDDAFRRASELSRKRPAPYRVSAESFRAILERAREKLSIDAGRRLAGAEFRVEPLPSLEAIRAGTSPEAQVARRRKPQDVLTLFQVNLENRAGDEAELAKLVGRVLARA
jgi:hypothetical protein